MRFDAKQLKEMSRSVRAWALHAIHNAHSGHVGIVLGAADIVTAIYANFLRRGRDRFVLSAGHGSAMLYSVLKLAGYDIGDMDSFRKIGGLPGHPEYGIDGVCATTGPLGQGVGNAVGMALAEKIKQSDGRVYCLCSDGDLMEGVAQESIAFAGRYRLNNLVLIWDDNGISIDGVAQTDIDVPVRMAAAGWRVIDASGNDFTKINRALAAAEKSSAPVFIQMHTTIGLGTSLAGTSRAHGMALNDDEMMQLIQSLVSPAGDALWARVAAESKRVLCADFSSYVPEFAVPDGGDKISSRELSGMCLEMLLRAGVDLVGGSADLGSSTNARVAASRDITPDDFAGNYINYGVREHAMGAIMNGMAAAGVRSYGSTFLVFSDYMRPSIRLAALSGLPVIYVFTHDSIAVGEDGPTHQPVEQLPSLRLMPGLNVFRPCNAGEVAYAWRAALGDVTHPSCIVLSRQKIRQVPPPVGVDMSRGAYVIRPADRTYVRITIIATGSEVPLAIDVADRLGTGVQVVSMPNVGAFRRQNAEFKKSILRGFVVSIEAAATAPWFEFADAAVGIDGYGMSGDGAAVYAECGFNADAIAHAIAKNIKK